jgi:hypothetical protein
MQIHTKQAIVPKNTTAEAEITAIATGLLSVSHEKDDANSFPARASVTPSPDGWTVATRVDEGDAVERCVDEDVTVGVDDCDCEKEPEREAEGVHVCVNVREGDLVLETVWEALCVGVDDWINIDCAELWLTLNEMLDDNCK